MNEEDFNYYTDIIVNKTGLGLANKKILIAVLKCQTEGGIKFDDLRDMNFRSGYITALYQSKYLKVCGQYAISSSETNPIYIVNLSKLLNIRGDYKSEFLPTQNQNQKKEHTMNTTTDTLINSLYENLNAVQVVFSKEVLGSIPKQYTYKTFLDLEIGDEVVVDSPNNGLTVVKVVGVDSSKLQENYRFKWVVQKIDTAEYCRIVENENIAIDKLNKLVNQSRRKEAAAKVKEMLGDNDGAFEGIQNDLNSLNLIENEGEK